MRFVSWCIAGSMAGGFAGIILKGNDFGPVMDFVIGIVGAAGGGFLMQSTGLGGHGATASATLVAMISALLLTLLAKGKKIIPTPGSPVFVPGAK